LTGRDASKTVGEPGINVRKLKQVRTIKGSRIVKAKLAEANADEK
jgi:hypothetical protein